MNRRVFKWKKRQMTSMENELIKVEKLIFKKGIKK